MTAFLVVWPGVLDFTAFPISQPLVPPLSQLVIAVSSWQPPPPSIFVNLNREGGVFRFSHTAFLIVTLLVRQHAPHPPNAPLSIVIASPETLH